MDYDKIAIRLEQENTPKLKAAVDTALATLEQYIGYSLTPLGTTEKRLYPVDEFAVWQRVDPFFELTSVRISDGRTSSLLENYQLGQNGELNGQWYNGIKLCGCFAFCRCFVSNCSYFEIDAKFGFAAPTVDSQDSTKKYATLPADLTNVLDALVTDSLNPKADIKSESRGTRSYTRFDRVEVADKFASTIRKYKRGW